MYPISAFANPGLDPDEVTNITYKIHQQYLGGGIQYYSCFISYSSKNHEFAQRLYDDLQDNGVRCWFAPEDMKIGDQIRPTTNANGVETAFVDHFSAKCVG